jgi:hypothetical protein
VSETEHDEDMPETPAPDEAEEEQEGEAPGELEPDAPDEGEPEQEPEQPSDEDRSRLAKSIDTRFKTYRKNVEEKLSDEVTDWLLCPLCASGMVPSFVNRHDLGRVPEDVAANVQTFLGFAREGEYQQDPGTQTCPTCAGKTKVKTGATAGEHIVRTCPNCKGYGFMPPPGSSAGAPAANGGEPAPATADPSDFETPDRDNWGEPRILPDGTLNENYGKQPQFKTRHPVYGETRLLTPEELVAG